MDMSGDPTDKRHTRRQEQADDARKRAIEEHVRKIREFWIKWAAERAEQDDDEIELILIAHKVDTGSMTDEEIKLAAYAVLSEIEKKIREVEA
jgi:hypothetical protein